MSRFTNILASISFITLAAPGIAAAQSYDGAANFSLSANPNGVWTYGSAPALGQAPAPFTKKATGPLEPAGSVSFWNTGAPGLDAFHAAFANQTAAPVTVSAGLVVNPGVFVLHPSNKGAYAVLRFTAPEDAVYDIKANFKAIDAQAKKTDAAVLVGGAAVCQQASMTKMTLSCDKTGISLKKGQTIDFAVGNGGDGFLDDSVQVDARITRAAATLDGWYRLKTQFRGEGECLEGNQASSPVHQGAAFMDTCKNATGQLWQFVPAGNGYYRMKTQFRGAGECLEGNQASSPVHGGAAFMDTCKEATGQLWKLEPAGNGYYRLKTQFRGAGECLEGNQASSPVHGGAAFMDTCKEVNGQLWKLEKQP